MPPPRLPHLRAFTTATSTSTTRSISLRSLPALIHNPNCRAQRLASQRPSSQLRQHTRALSSSTHNLQEQPPQPQPIHPPQHYNFYRTHGRAFFKTFALAFLTYQTFYWAWLTLEAEEERDAKSAEIRGLEGEVRLLTEGRGRHVGDDTKDAGGRAGDGKGEAG